MQESVCVLVQRQLDILHQLRHSVRTRYIRDGARPNGGAAQVAAETSATGAQQRNGSERIVAQPSLDSLT